jgi:hypothetical protein
MTRRARKIVTPLLAILGVQAWLLVLNNWGYNSHLILLAIAMGVSVIGPVHRIIWHILSRLRRPSPIGSASIALLVAIGSGAWLAHSAISNGRALFPVMHDENQFLLQARMLASGHLWMPGHPLVDFFDTFYVLIQPKYAAQSFPGTAMFYVPAIWWNIAPWKWAVGIASLTVGMFYLVVTELIDGLGGLLGAILLVVLSMFRFVSTMVLAQTPLMLLGLTAMWIYLQSRKSARRKWMWMGMLGFFCGWMIVTRPSDSVIFCAPILIAICIDFAKGMPRDGHPWVLFGTFTFLIGLAPWILLQLVFDHGATGNWFTTPFAYYNHRDQPRLAYGIRAPDIGPAPQTRLREKRQYYHDVVEPLLAVHRPDMLWQTFETKRFPLTIADTLPQPLLLALVPMGVLAWRRRRAWVLGMTLPLFWLVYTFYPLFPEHYTVIVGPAVVLTILLGARAMTLAWPRTRAGVWAGLAVFVVGLLFTQPLENSDMIGATAFPPTMLQAANQQTARLAALGKPAVVLFRRRENIKLDFEPVYNLDAAWPDDELIIRAHDRGTENWKIFQYYAEHGADRAFYLFDESRVDGGVRFLGMGSELARTSVGH